jgi:DNA-binding transcriptional LysR family regulator
VDLRAVDLNLLVSLDALLHERNVTRAAERLHLSQPALSAQLSRLRQVFGDPLLIPATKGRGMVATARALELQAPLHALLADLGALLHARPAFDPHHDVRSFAIASSDNGTVVAGLPVMEALRREAGPGVRVAFRYADAARIAEQMERGDVDFLIGSERMVPPAMRAVKLLDERFVMAQRKGHPRGTAPLDIDSYCGALEHLLVSTSGGSFEGFMDEHLQRLGRQRRVVLSVQQFILAPAILAQTDYVCTLPRRLVARHAATLDAFELPFEAQGFTLYLAWHPRDQADAGHAWMRQLIVRSAQASDAASGSAVASAAPSKRSRAAPPAVRPPAQRSRRGP